jgi:hypothetical protein
MMSTNSSALVGTWIDAESEKPPKLECYGEFWHSVPVLVTDGKQQWVGYWQSWEDGESLSSWYVAGPDGYQITGVTHWMPLPPLPNAAHRVRCQQCQRNYSKPDNPDCPECGNAMFDDVAIRASEAKEA